MGAVRRPNRAVPAWISRHRLRLAQFRSATGRVRLAGGGAVHARLRAVVDPVGRQLSHRRVDARRPAGACGGRRHRPRRGDRPRLGCDGRQRSGRDPGQPIRQSGDHVGATGCGVSGAGSPIPAGCWRRSRAQLLRSWYIMYFQLPWLPERSASWVLPRLWRRWSPGYDAKADLRHVDAAIGTPESWRAALGPYRATIRNTRPPTPYANCTSTGCRGRSCRACTCTDATTVA